MQKRQTVLLKIMKFLLMGTAAFQTFLSVYGIYEAGSLRGGYYFLLSVGNILNIGLVTLFLVYLYLAVYVWGNRQQAAGKAREYLRAENLLLAALLGWIYLSGFYHLIKGDSDVFISNSGAYGNALVHILLFFLLGQYLAGDKKILHFLFRALVIGLTAAMLYVLVRLVLGGPFTFSNGAVVYFTEVITPGMKRLCVNAHPNTTGMYAKTLISLCLYLFVLEKKRYRYLYLAAAAVHYEILTLTSSRAAMISAGVCVGGIVMLGVWRKIWEKNLAVRILVAISSFAGAFLLFLLLRAPSLELYNGLRGVFSGQESVQESQEEEEVEFREMGNDISGRQILFRAAFSGMKDPQTALFGVTPAKVTALIDRMAGIDWHVYTHNEFLEIMCAVGIPGMLFFAAWFLCIAVKGFLICYDAGQKFRMEEGTLVIVCFAELLNNMMEAMLTFSTLLSGIVFFVAAGYLLTDYQTGRGRIGGQKSGAVYGEPEREDGGKER